MWSGLQPELSNAHTWYGPPWQNVAFPTPSSPEASFDRYGSGSWVESQRPYDFVSNYHRAAQRAPSCGLPSQMSSYQPILYTYPSNNFDPGPILQQPQPFHSINHGAWNHQYGFAANRPYGIPMPKGNHVEDRRRFEPSSPTTPTVSRGPPLKPRRSGHALWVGNLHPTTSIVALKNHFSQRLTEDIESVFLITRSTCAFVNYRSEKACKYALAQFHSSILNGNNLVCRIRRDPGNESGGLAPSSPLGPQRSSFSGESGHKDNACESPTTPVIVGMSNLAISSQQTASISTTPKVPMRFFILKSLTVQDLEASVRKNEWVTQAKNEVALNNAFHEAETVYLIFSVNRSGEYFGFARLTSAISADRKSSSVVASDEPENTQSTAPTYIHTPATTSAPKGRIVDDSARGTLFWEACSLEDEEADDKQSEARSSSSTDEGREESMGNTFGVEWLSTTKLPFICTRGLRNPWNANREVKVARDGTEIEPRTGRRLLALFNGQAPPNGSWSR